VSEDRDLRRLFDAQRTMDEALAPSFDDLHTEVFVSPSVSRGSPVHESPARPVAVALLAIALSGAVGYFTWTGIRQPDEPLAPATAQADLQELNRVCDSLLITIRELDRAADTRPNPVTTPEMEWPTGTDSLMPFNALTFNTRTSP